MEIQDSRERVLHWIARKITIDGENAVWVTTTPTLITKALLFFPTKVLWVVVHAQLRPTVNDNTLSSSLAFLIACLLVGYPINLGRIRAIELRDRALNERAELPFPCLIGKLCRQANIPPNRLINRWGEAAKLIQVSKIKDVVNHLFGAKSRVVGTLVVVPRVPLDIPQADKGPEKGGIIPAFHRGTTTTSFFLTGSKTLVHQIVNRMPQLIQRDVLPAKKEIKYEMRKELDVLKDRMDGLENLVQDRFQVPTPVMPDSLMQLLNQAPSTQSIDNLWGELPKSKSGKRKHKAGESDKELPADLSKKERWQHKKACRALRREAREKEAPEQQRRKAVLARASGSGAPSPASGSQPDPVLSSESSPIDKGADAEPTTGA
uniref:Putative plant transposon protein domain-containing protein n=1 Tax=Solanum tuberosum TaxID=4113 RepID=M1DN98_SOLTU